MNGLYLLFMRQVARQSAVFCLVTAVGLIAVQQFFFQKMGLASYLVLTVAWLGIALYQAGQCIPKNINWIAILPISRLRLLLLTSILNSSILLLSVLCFCIVVIGVDLFKFGSLQNTPIVWSTVTTFLRFVYRKLLISPSAFSWATLFLVTSYLFALITSPTWRGTRHTLSVKLLFEKLWYPDSQKQRLQNRSQLIALLLLLVFGKNFVLAPFGVFCAFLLAMAKLCPRLWKVSLNINRREQLLATSGLLFIGFIEMGWVYGLERRALRSQSTDERVGAIEFLGPFAGKLPQTSLAEILESGLSKEAITTIGPIYLSQFHAGKKINKTQDSVLSFEKAVASKVGLSAILKTLELFETSTLTKSDLEALFRAMSPLSRDPRENRVFLMLLQAKVSHEEVKVMLQSGQEAQVRYGLMRARYDRNPSYLEVIQKQMVHYSDEVVYAALQTLSVMKGQRLTLDDWREFRAGRALASHLFEANCQDLKVFDLENLTPNDIATLNACLRERANTSDLFLLEDIEDAGWIAPPINAFQKTVLLEVYDLVN